MNFRMLKLILVALVAVLPIAGCSDGGGSSSTVEPTSSDIVSTGAVTELGSVTVNGVLYQTQDKTRLRIEDQEIICNPGTPGQRIEDRLRLGMVVTVQGTLQDNANGIATLIEYTSNLEGRVTSVDPGNHAFVAMGQTVLVDDATVLDGINLAALANLQGMDVEVSGYAYQDGTIRATRVQTRTGLAEFQVKGTVQNLNTVNKTFTVGELTVDYSLAEKLQFSLQNGEYVEVRVPAEGFNPEQNRIMANNRLQIEAKLRIQERTGGIDCDYTQIEGAISGLSASSPEQFEVNGLPVVISSGTVFTGGDPSDLSDGIIVAAKGSMANGKLMAAVINLKNFIKMDAYVEASDAASITEMGILVSLNEATALDGITSEQLAANSLVDSKIKICAYASGDLIIANRLELKLPSEGKRVMLQGIVADKSPPAFSVLDVTIDTGSVPVGGFLGVDDNVLTSSEFFNLITSEESIVRSYGTYTSATRTITADQVIIEWLTVDE